MKKDAPEAEQSRLSGTQQCSQMRLISSSSLSIEMAVNYLFQWRNKKQLFRSTFQRILMFPQKQIMDHIPTITYIMSITPQQEVELFAQNLALKSMPAYLMIRWSYSAFQTAQSNQFRKNKLDSALIRRRKQQIASQSFKQQKFHKNLQQRVQLSQYTCFVNQYFQRLFQVPQKLKSEEKQNRVQKLRKRLTKIEDRFKEDVKNMTCKYAKGVVFPIQDESCLATRIMKEHCYVFSTKQRVPFKLTIQTISLQDAQKLNNIRSGQQKKQSEINSPKRYIKPLILPQTYFGTQWCETVKIITSQSPYSSLSSYKIRTYIVKSGDDLRQQYMAMRLIKMIQDISQKENLKLWIRSYSVIPYNQDSGLIQFVDDTRTISWLKQVSGEKSLKKIYQQIFGDNLQVAILNFTQSLAAYSLLQYLFQIKDRHNNNILIDTAGHVIHIDFSFIISSSPGNMNFEKAPFKLTEDYLAIMEGPQSDIFQHYKLLFFLGLKYLRKYKKQILQLIIMMSTYEDMKCFKNFNREALQERFHENATDIELEEIVKNILDASWNTYHTSAYDKFQWFTNNIHS